MARKYHTLPCKSLEAQAILAQRNSLKSDFRWLENYLHMSLDISFFSFLLNFFRFSYTDHDFSLYSSFFNSRTCSNGYNILGAVERFCLCVVVVDFLKSVLLSLWLHSMTMKLLWNLGYDRILIPQLHSSSILGKNWSKKRWPARKLKQKERD